MSKVHKQKVLGKRWSCNQCGAKFSNQTTLKIHTRSHSGKKAHKCHVCNSTFLVARSLQLHMKTHFDSQHHNIGPKKYFLENEEHVNLNSRERCYKCELCLHLFPKREEISNHLKQIHRILNEDVRRKHITFLMTSYSKPESPAPHEIQTQKSVEDGTPEKLSPGREEDISKINSPITNMELFISQLELVPMRPIDTGGASDPGKAATPKPAELDHPPSSVGPREVMYMRGFEDNEPHVIAMTIGNEGGEKETGKESDGLAVNGETGKQDTGKEITDREWAKLNKAFKEDPSPSSSKEKGRGDGTKTEAGTRLDDDLSLDMIASRFNKSTDSYLKDATSYDDPAFKTAMRIAEETSKQFAEMMNWSSLYNLYDSKSQQSNVNLFSQEEVMQFLQLDSTHQQETKPETRRRRRRKNSAPTKISAPQALDQPLGRVNNRSTRIKTAPKSTKPKRQGTPRIIPRKKYTHKCHICASRFPDDESLADHMKRHVGNQTKYIKCRFCPKVFSTKYTLNMHERIHSDYRPFNCKVCGKGFYQRANIKVHMRAHTGERPYKCEICGKAYSVKISLAAHSGSHPENKFACNRCKFCFARADELEEHMKVHAIQKTHECPKCRKTFLKAYLLEFHLQRGCKDKKFICNYCGKQFSCLDYLKTHQRVHTGEKPFGCEICGKFFSQSANLTKHLRIHNNIRAFACDFCPSTFIEKASMQAHRRTHTGEKPHMCDICGTAFSSPSSLVIHMRKHTGEKPFPCDMCEKRFSSSGKLRDHYRTHTGEKPYKCRMCDKAFALSNGLVRHTRIHTGERPHKCGFCGQRFMRKDRLTRHMTVHKHDMKDNMSMIHEDSRDSHASRSSMVSHVSHVSHASHASHDPHMLPPQHHQHHPHQQHQQHHQQLQPMQAHQQQPQPQPQHQRGNMMNMPGFVAPQPMFGCGYLY